MPVCRNCGEDNPERARFCLACGRPISAEAPVARDVRKTVTVVFTDVSGSTDLGSRLDPESLRHVMNRYFDRMRSVVERHGGIVEKFIGDAVMAVFGVPQLHEDDALRAVRAAADMQLAVAELNRGLQREWGVTISTRTGVNTGVVVAGDPSEGQAIVSGDCVNVASRLQDAARPGEILMGEATYGLVKDFVDAKPRQLLLVKGKDEPLPAFPLRLVRQGEAEHAGRLSSPLVGRELELGLLLQALARAERERACHLFTVIGAPGVGKTRLVEEFLQQVRDRVTVLHGHCLPYGEGITFWPVIQMVREAAGITDGDSPEQAVKKIRRQLDGYEDADLIADRVAQVIGLREAAVGTEGNFWAIRKLLEALCRTGPVVLALDDATWAEPTLLDLIDHVADWSRDVPLLLVCVARQELLDQRTGWGGGKTNAATILLEPLTHEESELLVANLLGPNEMSTEVRDRVTGAAEGNPLFLEEMLFMLIDEGLLERADGSGAAAELKALSIPASIWLLLTARLDRLAREERDVLARASVVGKVFYVKAVIELSPKEERPHVSAYLGKLERKELIRPEPSTLAGEEAFRFRHTLIRDAAYQSLPKETRADLHERVATWIERSVGDRIREYGDVVGYHLEQSCRYRAELGPADAGWRRTATRAASTLASAGRRAFALGDMSGAIGHLSRAISLLPDGDPARLDLLPDLGAALWEAGEFGRADAVLGEAIDQAKAVGREVVLWRAAVERCHLRLFTDPQSGIDEALAVAEQAIPVFEGGGDELGLAKAWRLRAQIDWIPCRAAETEKSLERAIEHARLAGDPGEEAEALSMLALATLFGPTPAEEGLARCSEILESAADNRRVRAAVLRAQARFEAMLGRFAEARDLMNGSRALLEDLGQHAEAAGIAQGSYFVEMLAGDPVGAERELRRGYEILHGLGERSYLSTLAAMLAHALYAQGRFEEAEQFSRISGDAAAREDLTSNILWRSARAKILARRGDLEVGLRLAEEATKLAEETDFLNIHGDALSDQAEVLRLAGEAEEAASALEEALALYERKGNRVAARNASAHAKQFRG